MAQATQIAPSEQEEFEFRLRAEREAATGSSRPMPSMGEVALNAVPRGVANLLNTPVALWNLGKLGAHKLNPQASVMDQPEMTPNYPAQAFEKIGLIDPSKAPQTAGQRIVDAVIQGGIGGALGPGGIIKNAAIGGLSGLASQGTKEVTDSDMAALAAGIATPFAVRGLSMGTRPATNPVREATLREGQAAGYVVPPSDVRPSWFNNRLESLAGKAAVRQDAAARNQAVTNALAAKALGLPPDTPLTPTALAGLRQQAGTAYDDVSALSPKAEWALPELKQARHDATLHFKHYNKSGDPAALQKAQEAKAWAGLLENEIEDQAKQAGRSDLVKALAEARTKIAKSHDVERALGEADANVSAPILGRAFDQKGGNAMTGELSTIAKMAEAYPAVMREGARVPTAGVSGTDAAASALLGAIGFGAGGPAGLTAAALPLLRGPARQLALSSPYQRLFAVPPAAPESIMNPAIRSALAANIIAGRTQQ